MEESMKKAIGKIAIENNNKAWSFLALDSLSSEDIALMLESAYTSLHLWSLVGKDINIARGHWLVARAHINSGHADLANIHAQRCEEFTVRSNDGKESFDLFYLNEVLARVSAMEGDFEMALSYIQKARDVSKEISDKETLDLCLSDLKAGPWFGFVHH